MKPAPARLNTSRRNSAVSSACPRLSSWHGPQMKVSGRLLPISIGVDSTRGMRIVIAGTAVAINCPLEPSRHRLPWGGAQPHGCPAGERGMDQLGHEDERDNA